MRSLRTIARFQQVEPGIRGIRQIEPARDRLLHGEALSPGERSQGAGRDRDVVEGEAMVHHRPQRWR
jgi:hypothetical protein